LKQRYGSKIWKICVDAGFTCPNRDPETGKGGCAFCRIDSFSRMHARKDVLLLEQIEEGIRIARRRNINRYIIYFQASTNTFAPIPILRQQFEQCLKTPGMVGLAIATRPDCLSDPVLHLIDELAQKTDVWIELGLQSAHDHTLKRINRGHSLIEYTNAVEKLKRKPVRICTHVMAGLPGESKTELIETAQLIARNGTHEIKLHPMLILKDTQVEKEWQQGTLNALELDDYVSMCCDVLQLLPPDMVIQRLTAEAPSEQLVAPRWAMRKQNVLNRIERELERRGTRQGSEFIS
jgi:hypothetical protein